MDEPPAELIVASLPEGLVVVGSDGRVAQANAAMAQLWGVPAGEIAGTPLTDLARADADPVQRALAGKTVQGVLVEVERPDGTRIWAEVNAAPLEGGNGAVATYRDVTARVYRERRMRHEADSDPLTGLANRRALERTLDAAVERARNEQREVAVLVLDLDGFKALNDRWGHLAGDRALRAVARRLLRCVRERDLVARSGGDEFVLVLGDLLPRSPVAAECRARVEGALSAPVRFEGGSTTLGAAIGIATFPADGADGLSLLAHADRAMYASKPGPGRA